MALEISCLETSVEVEDVILWCSRGKGGSSWAPPAFPRCAEHPASPESPGSQASPSAKSILWQPEPHTEPRAVPGARSAQPRVLSVQMGAAVGSLQ